MISSNEVKLMNEENWFETTKSYKNREELQETDEEICVK